MMIGVQLQTFENPAISHQSLFSIYKNKILKIDYLSMRSVRQDIFQDPTLSNPLERFV